MLLNGRAFVLACCGELKNDTGNHWYPIPPLALKRTDAPAQIVSVVNETTAVGAALITILVEPVTKHPLTPVTLTE